MLDTFTRQRVLRFADSFRNRTAQLPTLKDFEAAGLDKKIVQNAVKEGSLSELYVTLTNGAVVKGYKRRE